MRRLESLIVESLRAARFRGHEMNPYRRHAGKAYSECRHCDAGVIVDCSPPPNGIDIMGSAVAVNCGLVCVNAEVNRG